MTNETKGKLLVTAHLAVIAAFVVACASSVTQQDVAKRTYEGEQAACVAAYATRAEIDSCRATVRQLWGLPARDAGADGGQR